ncbi:hypothetical protein [Streptomyces sp. NPDC014733]|uniref:hypothetical protein n=1 Tax=Streptomyces sp. NPDC014733 TaxID=3364885 RepID=UPI0036F5D92B
MSVGPLQFHRQEVILRVPPGLRGGFADDEQKGIEKRLDEVRNVDQRREALQLFHHVEPA